MGTLDFYMDNLGYYSSIVLFEWEKNRNFISQIDSFELFKIVKTFYKDDFGKKLIERDLDKILEKTTESFNIFDSFTVLLLKANKIYNNDFDLKFFNILKEVISSNTLMYISRILKDIERENINTSVDVYNHIFSTLKSKNNEMSSICLFDMSLFPDFREELKKRYHTVFLLIDKYQKYDPDVIGNMMFKGSSIIGKLIHDENQYIAEQYITDLCESKDMANIEMIGGGSTCLVLKIGKNVLKLGENRHCRKIYINHRILASLKRKLHVDRDNKPLFYAEVMKYVETEGITIEDLEELKSDLFRQGLEWDDPKIENCGILDENDDNVSLLPVDYIEVAGNIDNPIDREEFQKRKRKVVVIDNDCIRYNPIKSCR